MDKINNPFTPGAGFMPPELAGRHNVLEEGVLVAKRTRLLKAERGMLLIGPRGVGKTAVLKHLSESARQDGIVAIVAEVRDDGQIIEELALKVREALLQLDVSSKFKSGIREAFSSLAHFVRRFSLNIGSVGVEIETDSEDRTSGNIEYDLSELLLASARAAKASKSAIGLYLDELQNMQGETLSGIIVALHHAAQDMLPLYLIGSGLPTVRALIGKSKTYAERMFVYEPIGPLAKEDSFDAIRKPLLEAGVNIDNAALEEMHAASQGYPFFLQELGYQVWQAAERSPISRKDVTQNLSSVFTRLDRNFFDVRFDRITPAERQFLRAMADLPDAGGVGISALADALGKPPSAISMTRRSLIRKGMIYSPQLGTIAYTVPMFAQYMLRIMPTRIASTVSHPAENFSE